ncbi:MAG: glycoside hydrolase family 15 protein [Nocardioidaceae bacterium]
MSISRDDLVATSVKVILDGQDESGGYVAGPTFPTYQFAWFRDGSYCALAMETVDGGESAGAFHAWAVGTVLRHREVFEAATRDAATLPPSQMPPARFELDGSVESGAEGWPNFQLDGYGTWLWVFADHLRHVGRTPSEHERDAVRLVADYLAVGDRSCSDCWEEYVDRRHAATIGASAAGLGAAARLLDDERLASAAAELVDVLAREFVRDGALRKDDATVRVDASLLWLALPLGVFDVNDAVFAATVDRVADDLQVKGRGVRRYLGDTYYGGGEWLLLTAWLGWVRCAQGNLETARLLRGWIEEQATEEGWLTEQVLDHPQDEQHIAPWQLRWGPVATPLLWSHAMYLILDNAIGEAETGR